MNDSFTLASLPETLTWKNQPVQSTTDTQGQLSIANRASDRLVQGSRRDPC